MIEVVENQLPQGFGSNVPEGLAWEPLDSAHILACDRRPVAEVLHVMPQRWLDGFLNHPKDCCKDYRNLDIEAWYSSQNEINRTLAHQVMAGVPLDQARGVPDIYKFHCSCGKSHVRFCVGGNHPTDPNKRDDRPFWETR